MNVIAIGSCMSNLPISHLQHTYGWTQTHSVHHNRSDAFLGYFVDRTIKPIPQSYLDELLIHKKDQEPTARQFLRNQFEQDVGFHDLAHRKKSPEETLFTDLQSMKIDVILMDNLMDVSALLSYPTELPGYENSGIFLNHGFYENEKEVASKFRYGRFLTPEESAANWIRIAKWLRSVQPDAKLFFLCYHSTTSRRVPDRYERIERFYEVFARTCPDDLLTLVPPLTPPDSLTKGESDWPHFDMRLYHALAGYIFLQVSAGLTARRGWSPSRLPPVHRAESPTNPDKQSTANPYAALPDRAYWRRAITRVPPEEVDPVDDARFMITKSDRVATAGSCFAQHISRFLTKEGFNFYVPEAGPSEEGYGVFSCRYGNIYTIRQLRQLLQRCTHEAAFNDLVWRRADGKFVDPFRPYVVERGFDSPDEVRVERTRHLAYVKKMFEECDVFVYTLGLTEGWMESNSGALVPFAPGVVGTDGSENPCSFVNFTTEEMQADLTGFIDDLQSINERVKIVLTVSPVPLIASYEPRHVLVSNTASKSALRAVADTVCRRREKTAYFPSYEIITGPHTRMAYFADDLREVTPLGVARVMELFAKHYLDSGVAADVAHKPIAPISPNPTDNLSAKEQAEFDAQRDVIICDELRLESLK